MKERKWTKIQITKKKNKQKTVYTGVETLGMPCEWEK